jgi:EAL and modified HD-GYP domain-containing signal transduction protein
VYDENWARFLNIVQIVKIDVIVTPLNTIGSLIHKIKNLESTLHGSRPKLLAEKIETVKVYEEAKTLGFDYFQGYLFGKPELVTCNIQQLLTA